MMIGSIHFSNPAWFYGLIPLFFFYLWVITRKKTTHVWQDVCDAHLLPFLLEGQQKISRANWGYWVLGLAWIFAVVSLAEPAWHQVEQPIFSQKTARVFLLHVSNSMLNTDLPPARLDRAKFKLLDMFNAIHEGQTALVAYSAEPFLVSPLTEDSHTIAAMIPNITADIMPVQGNDLSAALGMAKDLLKHDGQSRGEVIVLTDSEPTAADFSQAESLHEEGIRTSVLGIGSAKAAPLLNSQGQFLTDASGNVKTDPLPVDKMKKLASAGGGVFALFSSDNKDVEKMLKFTEEKNNYAQNQKMQLSYWAVEGRWLILVVVILFLMVFRRGFRWQ